ncbi:amidohydrolase family protein [Sungkyunkwania multivorans]|uniref:Amidohydrolase family protein n=1 Tax=Sungkyunkwania multivorans TaxID=1173618 RepID=A0ABW3CU75_9FLAO
MRRIFLALSLLMCSFGLLAQDYFPKNDGVKTENDNYTAFVNARIFATPTQIIDNGSLLIQNGKIIAVGTSVTIPANAILIDLEGKYIYPSFIDIYSDFGITKPKRNNNFNQRVQYGPSRKGYYWNDHITPEINAVEKLKFDDNKAKELVKAGFGTVNTHHQDGIIRGTSTLIALNVHEGNEKRILGDKVAQHFSFRKGNSSRQSYPTSLMGAMALIRQVYHDAKWYGNGGSETDDRSLEAFNRNKGLPQIFDAGSMANSLRADKIANEFGVNYILKGGGDEYARINEVKATNASYVLPLDFPKPYDVSDPISAAVVELKDMRHWNQAPTNAKVLAENGIPFAFTTAELKKVEDFKTNLMKAIDYGLSKTTALEALTTVPARLLGKSDQLGNLKKGAVANFLITSGDLFEKKTILYENWVQGNKNVINDIDLKDIRGNYDLNVAGEKYSMAITGEPSKPKIELKQDSIKIASKINYKNGWINIFFTPQNEKATEFIRLNAVTTASKNLSGRGTLTNGNDINWTAIWKTKEDQKEEENEKGGKDKNDLHEILPVTFPNTAYGLKQKARQENILFKNATVWTNERDGILQNSDVLIKNGKIAEIGKNLSASGARIIDASGKHLTTGIVDEHSHIAAAAINEGGHNSSAEVTIEDVVSDDDIDIFRNLAGGVTSIQILHGSANPIGGRSAIIKLKWGEAAENLLNPNADPFIKFALGENVKQSNWGDNNTSRFPQTRMGVEQVYVDYFQRAKAYDQKWKAYNDLSSKAKSRTNAPRYDIELAVLAQILNKERFISCHSYVQSEINMLMKVVERFNFNVNTFTHILEGYKVADKMAKHGVAGSTFSDWWAYKYEVNDAIPYNAAIMHSQGVLTAINSDSGEMSRRLNQEAAKSVKYGGVSEEDAWKFVTLNPAKMLHLDDKIGSIKVGKDADLVLWTDHPMSIYAKAEKTMIEGAIYYDLEKLPAMTNAIKKERNKLINMMLKAKNNGMKTQPAKKKKKEQLHCDSLIYQQ